MYTFQENLYHTEAWRARSSRLGQEQHIDKPAQSSLPPGDVPAQHIGIQTRSKVKAANVHTSTPEIRRSESTPTVPTMDLTVEPLLTENVNSDSCQESYALIQCHRILIRTRHQPGAMKHMAWMRFVMG